MLRELLIEEMKDIYHAETQLVKALPKMAKAARSKQLKEAFQSHLEETQGHVERLKQAFEMLGEKAKTKTCEGMKGLIEEGQDVISEFKKMEEPLSDLALIAAAQRIEHYEIATYGTVRTMAEQLGETRVARLLMQTLNEEERADKLLTKMAMPMYKESHAEYAEA
jgi:ferritin-like metal-binding protein YciE